jgi:hypothetical protein
MAYNLETSYLLGEDGQSTISDYLVAFDPDGLKAGQTWTVAAGGYSVGKVSFKMAKVGSPGNITCKIYATSSGKPTGAALGTATLDGNGFNASPTHDWEDFIFSPAIAVSGSTEYALVLEVASGDDSNHVEVRGDYSSAAYSNGVFVFSIDGGSFWTRNVDDDLLFYLYSEVGAPSKASNPTPADASGPGINFETPTLSWSGDGDTYDIYGGAAGNFVLLSSGQAGTSYTLTTADKVLFKNGVATWRVDSINDQGTTTGDDWTFDPRPAKVTNPSPATTSTGKSINQLIGWDAATYATSYDVWVNSGKMYSETALYANLLPLVTDVLDWGTLYTWRVDSNNYYGTTEGDEWTFTTLVFAPPLTTHRLLSDQSLTTDPFNSATMFFTGENFTATMRRLLAFCGSSLWYESIDAED